MDCLSILKRMEKRQIEQGEQLERILVAVEAQPAVGFVFTVEIEGQITEGATAITMTNSQQASATIQPVDKKGQPAPVDGVPVWASSDETIITVESAADGLSAVAVSHLVGVATILVEVDADLGEGVKPINGSHEVEVTGGVATGESIIVSAGEATPKA